MTPMEMADRGPFSDRLLVHRDQFAAEFGARRILVKYRSR
jgi:hypothetical protein